MGPNQLLGEEDVILNETYHTTVQCSSITAKVVSMTRDEFRILEHLQNHWPRITRLAKDKITSYVNKIVYTQKVKQKFSD